MTTAQSKPKSKAKPARKRADWDAVRRDFSTGRYTLRELQTKHGADHGLISRKARKEGWTQDLSIVIRKATNARLAESLVDEKVTESHQKVTTTIAAAVGENVAIIMGHRARLTDLALAVNIAKEVVLTLGSEVSGIREAGLFTQAICNLVTSTKVLLEQERKAYNLDNESERGNPQDAFAALLDDIASRGSRLPIEGLQ